MFMDSLLRFPASVYGCTVKYILLTVTLSRGFTVRMAVLFPNLVLKEPIAHAPLSVKGLNAPLVVEASFALGWDSQSPLESAESASTAEREPNLLYANAISVIYSVQVFNHEFLASIIILVGSTNTNKML